jgi:hypothetical protein
MPDSVMMPLRMFQLQVGFFLFILPSEPCILVHRCMPRVTSSLNEMSLRE